MRNIIANNKQGKSDHTRELQLKQMRYEKETWKRVMDFITEENIYLKNRLSEVLKDSFNYNLLEQLERFQTRFIKSDSVMDLLRHEVAELENLLATGIPGDDNTLIHIQTGILTLRNLVTNAEREFIKLKLDFNIYLSENI